LQPLFLEFLQKSKNQISTSLDLGFCCEEDAAKCQRVVRESVNESLPIYGIRTWYHLKSIRVKKKSNNRKEKELS
jgi:hypothetical protein